ncbi:MAG: DNA mismatch repair endonuclease MutL [Clostridia bacterium]|nr:DNA mismatch repair endonuclease MutL [Clostridia bacterium]
MSRIVTLSPEVANLIAAGEVVDRPASVVKELLENSIDAGATRITVESRAGGVAMLSVSDNGCGMSPEDAVACFGRHATSKVREAADLISIGTLGFRGEALASVAAVSRVTLRTRQADSEEGFEVVMEGGKLTSSGPCGCPVGTEIEVRDLFFNTPARKKFLKKEATETATIAGLLEKMALSRPDIAFLYKKDGRESLRSYGSGSLEDAAAAVLGEATARAMLPLSLTQGDIRVHGLCGTPESARPGRQGQIFFVLGRYVRSRVLQTALEEAYRGKLPGGRFPLCVLFVELPASRVDANVHPQKMEVKFADEGLVYRCVLTAVEGALRERARPADFGGLSAGAKAAAPSPMPSLTELLTGTKDSAALTLAQRPFAPTAGRRAAIDIDAGDWQYYGKRAEELRRERKAEEKTAPSAAGKLPSLSALVGVQVDETAIPTESRSKETAWAEQDSAASPVAAEACADCSGRTEEEPRSALSPALSDAVGSSPTASPTLSALMERLAAAVELPEEALAELPHTLPDPADERDAASVPTAAGPEALLPLPVLEADAPPGVGEEPAPALLPEAEGEQQVIPLQSFRMVGELFRTYLVAEFEDELWLVDKHAARERILYEQYRAHRRIEQQLLFTPLMVEPGRQLAALAMQHLETLAETGFSVDLFGDHTLVLRTLPMDVPEGQGADLLLELLELIGEGRRSVTPQLFDDLLHKVACTAAVKGGDHEAPAAGEALIRELLLLPDVRHCPHGRPCVKVLSRKTLAKEFLRG